MNLKDKKLLVVGGASQHCKVVEAAQSMGIKVYVIDNLVNSPAKLICDDSRLIDIFDIESITKLCIEEKIDGAISTSLDACQIPYQLICKKMGYHCFGSEKQFQLLTNKNLFKDFCRLNDIDVIPSYPESDVYGDKNVIYPIFIKPSDSRGSRGQSICYSKEEAIKSIETAKQFSSSNSVVIEKYMGNCKDFTVSYFCNDGKISLVRTGDRYEGIKGSGLENLCIASCSPSGFSDFFIKNINNKLVNMIKAMGIKNGPVFFQGFIDDDVVRLYDPGFRFAGGEYERVLHKEKGIDLIKQLVIFSITGKMDLKIDAIDLCLLNNKKMLQLDPTLSKGIISKIKGIEEIKKIPEVIYITQRLFKGDEVHETHDLNQRFGEICILCNNVNHLKEVVNKIQSLLIIEDSFGNNMICSPFNKENLI